MKTFKYLVTYAHTISDESRFFPYWVEVNRPIEELHHLKQLSKDVVQKDTATQGFLGNPNGRKYDYKLLSISQLAQGDMPEDPATPLQIIKFGKAYLE